MDRRNVTNDLQSRLRADLDRAGYYPRLVQGVLDIALAGEEVRAYLVHPETTFDSREVRRHLTALALTPTRLVMAHVDDVPGDEVPSAAATTEAVPIDRISSVALTHGVSDPAGTHGGLRSDDLTIAVTWGGAQQVDLAPAGCSDPDCEADHGYTGLLTPEDVVVRVSAQAEGAAALEQALAFARALSAATVSSP
ncbi:DUF5998 family protein [Georgenia satyanarayanai]|uniref:DUF5998 family protein n=1 Tax=Georgenia satyanarayanai TaxID=860221 RepID=UPI00203FD022|nr:DUF5998 family protein [Georgenia satyanarayanai]MCM3660146.1 DUF5998 family protein [Georgenia satyanarayanai]